MKTFHHSETACPHFSNSRLHLYYQIKLNHKIEWHRFDMTNVINELQLTINYNDSSLYRDLTIVYTKENWFVILLGHVHIGNWVTKMHHSSQLNINAQLRTSLTMRRSLIILSCLLNIVTKVGDELSKNKKRYQFKLWCCFDKNMKIWDSVYILVKLLAYSVIIKGTSGFMSNTLLIRFSIMLQFIKFTECIKLWEGWLKWDMENAE